MLSLFFHLSFSFRLFEGLVVLAFLGRNINDVFKLFDEKIIKSALVILEALELVKVRFLLRIEYGLPQSEDLGDHLQNLLPILGPCFQLEHLLELVKLILDLFVP